MSDKNRNMNDINDQKTAEQQAFSKEIRRRLAEPGSGKPTLDEFKVMVYKDREKRRKKRNALVACIVAAFIVGHLAYDDLVPEVGADKNPKETIQTEDGVIIEDGGWGSSIGEDNIWVVSEWEEIKTVTEALPNLVVPQYIPEGYTFNILQVDSTTGEDVICEYKFYNNRQELLEIEVFISEGEGSTIIDNTYKKELCSKGCLYIKNNNKTAILSLEDGVVVKIWYSLPNGELIKVVNGLNPY